MAGAAERRPARRRRAALAVAAPAALCAIAVLVGGAHAEAPSGRYRPTLDALVAFLQRDQNADGGFGGEPGSRSDQDITSWVALALAAMSINPHDQRAIGGKDVYTYLAEHAGDLQVTTDFERELMVVDAAESPPQPLGGVNLVEKVLEGRIAATGAFSHELGGSVPGMNDTIFAILALAPIKEPAVESVVRGAAEWVISEQDEGGSWPSWCPKSVCGREGQDPPGSTDMTGAALEALNAAGMPDTPAQARALAYLKEAQLADGGWPQEISGGERESNVGSTAWVVQGIWATGGNPESWVSEGGVEPLGYMASLQQPDGHVRYMRSHDSNGVWMTAYAGPAFAGQQQPIPLAAREVAPPPQPKSEGAATAPAVTATGVGKKGENKGFRRGEGVTAGGGGDGAPPFSRPEPQSKGKTPGGARVVRRGKLEAKDHSRDRRGADQHQPRGTETVEPRHREEVDPEAAAVSSGATAADPSKAGGGGDEGSGRGAKGAPLPVNGAATGGSTTSGEVVRGTVIGAPEGAGGRLAFGAPGLKSAGGGSDGLGAAIAIGVAALLAAGLGVGLEQRRGRLA